MHRFILRAAGLAACSVLAADTPPPGGGVPVAPILPAPALGWDGALTLATASARAVAAPETGRLVLFALTGEDNVLFVNETWAGYSAGDPRAGRIWIPFGGGALWPVPTAGWAALQAEGLRPSRVLDGGRWTGRAWASADGSPVCVLERSFPPPLNLEAQRTFVLDPAAARLRISDQLKRGEAPGIPAGPWSVLQVRRPTRIILPRGGRDRSAEDPAPGTARPMEDDMRLRRTTLPPGAVRAVDDAVVIRLQPDDELYLEPLAARPWIGLEIGRQVLVFMAGEGPGTVRFFADQGRPNAEIERVPEPADLPPGELLLQVNELRLGAVRTELTDGQLAAQARGLADDGGTEPAGFPARRPAGGE
jgi:hypothetical protein